MTSIRRVVESGQWPAPKPTTRDIGIDWLLAGIRVCDPRSYDQRELHDTGTWVKRFSVKSGRFSTASTRLPCCRNEFGVIQTNQFAFTHPAVRKMSDGAAITTRSQRDQWSTTGVNGWSEFPGYTDVQRDLFAAMAAGNGSACFHTVIDDLMVAAGLPTCHSGDALLVSSSAFPDYRGRGV